MKQFSLAGIPLRTVIKSSQAGIAISNHKWDPRQAQPELGLGRREECRPGSEPAVPKAPRSINSCSGIHGRGQRGWMGSMEK